MAELNDSFLGELNLTAIDHEFFELENSPFFWQAKALELHRAAIVIAQQVCADYDALKADAKMLEAGDISALPNRPPGVLNQFLLLAGFALECAFKGLWLIKAPHLASGGRLDRTISIHDLIELSRQADITLADDERVLCEIASSAITHFGRYPTSNRADKVLSQMRIRHRVFDVFDKLMLRITDLYVGRHATRTR